jgi:transcription-repair coupling factor (superfamily II helicase)
MSGSPASFALARHKITGVCPPARGVVIGDLVRTYPAPVWIVIAEELKTAEQLAEDIALFHEAGGDQRPLEALVMPESMPDSRDMREAFAASSDRLTVLSRLRAMRGQSNLSGYSSKPPQPPRSSASSAPTLVVATTPAALLQSVPALEAFATRELELKPGQHQSFQGLLEKLRELDYDSEAVCEAPGHYAIRGGIIDVYPITANQPYRLDFFGDDIEEIHAFDPVTQRSGDAVAAITISATPRLRLDPSKTGIADYLTPLAHLVFVEPAALDEEFSNLTREGEDGLTPLLVKCAAAFGVSDLDEASALFESVATDTTLDTESLVHHRAYPEDALVAQERLQVEEEARQRFLHQVATWKKERYDVTFVVSKEGEEQRAREILDADPKLKALKPRFLRGTLNEGFRITRRGADQADGGAVPTPCKEMPKRGEGTAPP